MLLPQHGRENLEGMSELQTHRPKAQSSACITIIIVIIIIPLCQCQDASNSARLQTLLCVNRLEPLSGLDPSPQDANQPGGASPAVGALTCTEPSLLCSPLPLPLVLET